MTGTQLTFRMAVREDTALILKFILELARYEKLEQEVVATEPLLEEWIFDRQKAEVIFAVINGKEIGFALFFHNFSTFLGRSGIYLEDLYVMPEYRGVVMASVFCTGWLRLQLRGDAEGWNGGAWTGISQGLISICRWGRSRWMNGQYTGLPARH